MRPQSEIRLLLIDAQHVVRQATAMLLGQQPLVTVVGEVASFKEATSLAFQTQPTVILIDGESNIGSPVDFACVELRRIAPSCRIVSFTRYSATQVIQTMVSVGVDGVTFKHMQADELVQAIYAVAANENYFPASLMPVLRKHPDFGRSQPVDLTIRQKQVLRLMAEEENNRAIANRMGVTEETVRSHVKNILRQLGVSSRTRAVMRGLETGLLAWSRVD